MTKFERIQKSIDERWGFRLYRNSPENALGRMDGSWKSGFTVTGFLRGQFYYRYRSLAEIERSWLMRSNTASTPTAAGEPAPGDNSESGGG